MGKWLLFLSTCVALQAMPWWSVGKSQAPGFLSIDCGSDAISTYTDDNGIEWVGDSDLITEGKAIPISGGSMWVLSTMRLFDGNQSKYCYSLTNSAVTAGAFFLVRGSFWAGITPPYTPQSADGQFRFKLIVDADEGTDVEVSYGTSTYQIRDVYVRAQRNSIDVCFARSEPGADAPFVSALVLRPLPPTLTSTSTMSDTSRTFVASDRGDFGQLSTSYETGYPQDPLDRLWLPENATVGSGALTTEAAISSTVEQLPARILQTAVTNTYVTLTYSDLKPGWFYFAEFYFAEIDPAVNASGQRTFNILLNGDVKTESPIDVFAEVGANAAYGYPLKVMPDATGVVRFNFTATSTSLFHPYLAAAEFFDTQPVTALTNASIVSTIDAIKTSLNLSSYKGDPCLPIGFGYEWLNCSQDLNIGAISLSNYGTGGEIPEALNTLGFLKEIHLDGNGLQGGIPDLSALTNLQVLVLSNNELSGAIPDYLATLKNLKVLDLQNNKLSGDIPAALLQRKEASTLKFLFSGNPLCESNAALNCTPAPTSSLTPPSALPSTKGKKGNSSVIVGLAVAVVLLVGISIGIAVYCMCKKRKPSSMEQPINKYEASPQQELPRMYHSPGPAISTALVLNNVIPKVSVREFTFQEIKVATNNFSTQGTKGGFSVQREASGRSLCCHQGRVQSLTPMVEGVPE